MLEQRSARSAQPGLTLQPEMRNATVLGCLLVIAGTRPSTRQRDFCNDPRVAGLVLVSARSCVPGPIHRPRFGTLDAGGRCVGTASRPGCLLGSPRTLQAADGNAQRGLIELRLLVAVST